MTDREFLEQLKTIRSNIDEKCKTAYYSPKYKKLMLGELEDPSRKEKQFVDTVNKLTYYLDDVNERYFLYKKDRDKDLLKTKELAEQLINLSNEIVW